MKYIARIRAFYHSNYPTYLVSIALFAALILALLSPRPAQAAIIGIDAGFFGGYGDARSQDGLLLPKVHFIDWGAYGLLGIQPLPWFKVGPYLEYHDVQQRTAPSSVNSRDGSGTGTLIGAGISFNFSPIFLLAAYGFEGSYDVDAPTSTGQPATLESPKSMHGIIGIYLNGYITLDFAYMRVEYSSLAAGRVTLRNSKHTAQDFRGGFSFHF